MKDETVVDYLLTHRSKKDNLGKINLLTSLENCTIILMCWFF